MEDPKLMQNKPICRLCLVANDFESVVFPNQATSALSQRIFDCTGVKLQDYPGECLKFCEMCISQLVICEKFIKVCRTADLQLQQLWKQRDEARAESILKAELVSSTKAEIPESQEPSVTVKGTGGEFYVVEIVDANHEYDIDDENVPERNGSLNLKEDMVETATTKGRKNCVKGKRSVAKSQCQVCGTMQQNLKQHMLVHTGEKRHVCPFCQKAFSQKGNLTYHMNHHSGKLPYKCDQCDKAYKDPQSLRSHKFIHTDERKLRCDVCDETFKYRSSLTVHLRCHTQDKRFPCTECPTAFITSSGLKTHMRTHTGERPYSCAECGKSFKNSHNLSQHKISHTKERRFQCDLCEIWFSYKNVLKAHMAIHLREDTEKHEIADKRRREPEKQNEG